MQRRLDYVVNWSDKVQFQYHMKYIYWYMKGFCDQDTFSFTFMLNTLENSPIIIGLTEIKTGKTEYIRKRMGNTRDSNFQDNANSIH